MAPPGAIMADETDDQAEYRANLVTRRNKAARKLAELDTLYLDYPNAPGSADYERHKAGLWDEIERLNALIAAADGAWADEYQADT